MSIIRNTTRHKITSILGVLVMFLATLLWLATYFVDLKKDVNLWQLAGLFCIGIILLFLRDDFISVLFSAAGKFVNRKSSSL
jgi:hypothetical protein